MIPLSEEELRRNMRHVAHAIAQQELEALTVDEETKADLHSTARGEIDTKEVRRRIHARLEKQLGRKLPPPLDD
ncbi:MAG: hypothetical protein ACRD3O_00080 [Terriglobia bacterium]